MWDALSQALAKESCGFENRQGVALECGKEVLCTIPYFSTGWNFFLIHFLKEAWELERHTVVKRKYCFAEDLNSVPATTLDSS